MPIMQAVVILACGNHANSLLAMLDETGVGDRTIVPALQARRKGFLENVPPCHREDCRFIYGCAKKPVMARALDLLARSQRAGELCPECVAHTWDVKQALLADVALDPACQTIIDIEDALMVSHERKDYYLCSEECRTTFLKRPDFFVERQEREDRIGRRDLAGEKPDGNR